MLTGDLTAIPTLYKDVQLKSRMEAQCAYLFDCLGWKWEYEKYNFMLPNGTTYTPDFWIESSCLFVECRGYSTDRGEHQIEGFARLVDEYYEHPELGAFDYLVIGPERASLFRKKNDLFVPIADRKPYQIGNGLLCKCGCGWTTQGPEWCPNCEELPERAIMISVRSGKVFGNGLPVEDLR